MTNSVLAQTTLISGHLGPDLQNILCQTCDHLTRMPKLTIDLRRMPNLQNITQRTQGFS